MKQENSLRENGSRENSIRRVGQPVVRDWSKVQSALEKATVAPTAGAAEGRDKVVSPGAVLLVGSQGVVEFFGYAGSRSVLPLVTPLEKEMVFDVASLTKVMITTTLVMQMVEAGELTLDRRLSRIFQTFGTHGKESMTIGHLLAHCSGYPPTAPFYKTIARAEHMGRAGLLSSRGAAEMVYNEIFRARLDNMPGKSTKYSDIGFLLLGHALEIISGTSIDKLATRNVIRPLELKSTGFIDLENLHRRGLEPVSEQIVPTAKCPWRGKVLCGEVHDDNAWAMGGIAAHAGLFSTAEDIHAFATEMINCYHGKGSLLRADTVRTFWAPPRIDPSSTWAYGWDTPSAQGSSAGRFFSANSVGHLAFTGCSLWIDPERELDVVLLTNRVHPTPDNQQIREFRPFIHDLVMETMGYAS